MKKLIALFVLFAGCFAQNIHASYTGVSARNMLGWYMDNYKLLYDANEKFLGWLEPNPTWSENSKIMYKIYQLDFMGNERNDVLKLIPVREGVARIVNVQTGASTIDFPIDKNQFFGRGRIDVPAIGEQVPMPIPIPNRVQSSYEIIGFNGVNGMIIDLTQQKQIAQIYTKPEKNGVFVSYLDPSQQNAMVYDLLIESYVVANGQVKIVAKRQN